MGFQKGSVPIINLPKHFLKRESEKAQAVIYKVYHSLRSDVL